MQASDGYALSVTIATPIGRRPSAPAPTSSPSTSPASTASAPTSPASTATSASPALPPVLALHGFASSAEAGWVRTGHIRALTSAGRTVIAPDLRGHGHSDKPHGPAAYSIAQLMSDLQVIVAGAMAGMTSYPDGHAPHGVDLLGYSMGSRLCATAAASGVLPVRRMVLGGFDGRPLFAGARPDRLARLIAAVPGNDSAALNALVTALTGLGGSGRKDAAGEPGSDAESGPGAGSDAGNVTRGEPASDVPTLIVAGDRDPAASRAAEYAARLPDGDFLPVAGRDHVSTVPASAFRAATVAFLGEYTHHAPSDSTR